MRADRAGVLTRAMNKVKRWSVRAKERVHSLPIRAAHMGLPIPPPRLLHKVGNSEDVARFLGAGAEGAAYLREVLERNGVSIEHLDAILDFGCGVGRVLRHFADLNGPAFYGTDYNFELIAWCARNLHFARFHLNGLEGRLAYEDEAFDFIYALSVFTHLAEPRQFFWIDELSRVLKPGGHLFLTTHGEHYLPQLTAGEQVRFRQGRLVVLGSQREGGNDCTAFHPEPYVRETLARGLEVVDFLPEAARGNPWQDVYLLRKP
jgi:SAM-dependent methyltransferase